MKNGLLFLLVFISLKVFAQETSSRQLPAVRTTGSFKIDGIADEAAWKDAPVAKDFVEWRPSFGAPDHYNTEVKILYDDKNIYISGYCHEKSADSVSHELAGRDKIGNSDWVGVIIDTYNDKINAVGFYVTTTGEQFDAKYSSTGGEDASWNAVWESDAKIHNDGWSFEMRIPYSALRFSGRDVQNWGLNILRCRQKTTQRVTWSPIDPKKNGFVNQEGEWAGITKISSPIRLSFSPYVSIAVDNYPYNRKGVKNTDVFFNGGMDIKYGLSKGFTLDMTLVPDFGQVASDNIVFNRSPFEIKYNENRSFFTEATELFNKGGYFYSRRIGGLPFNYSGAFSGLTSSDTVIKNPQVSKLINATKISGRTSHGLGIGFFNAVTKPSYAVIQDKVTGETRKFQTEDLTNYNIVVLDQTLKHNSSVSFINTSVVRSGSDYDADVTAALWDIYDKKNMYNWGGKVAMSNITGKTPSQLGALSKRGYAHTVQFGKTGGYFNFMLQQEFLNDKFDYNDMGAMSNNNYLDHYLWIGYKIVKPSGWYNNIYSNLNFTYSRRFTPATFQSFYWNFNANSQLKSLAYAGIFFGTNAKANDFYEPRKQGYVFLLPAKEVANIWYQSNTAKKYSVYVSLDATHKHFKNHFAYGIEFTQNYRFSDKFSLGLKTGYSKASHDEGFGTFSQNDEPLIAVRNLYTVENLLSGKFNFNRKHGITLTARHYWTTTDASQLLLLSPSGQLTPNSEDPAKANVNFNTFNIDMVYTWEFGPGSFLNFVWKNSVKLEEDEVVNKRYFNNLGNTLASPQHNNVSIKVLYYLDYLMLKKKTPIKKI
jgi:hypothetical protein